MKFVREILQLPPPPDGALGKRVKERRRRDESFFSRNEGSFSSLPLLQLQRGKGGDRGGRRTERRGRGGRRTKVTF